MLELVVVSSKPRFEDYSAQRTQENEQAYLAAGYSPAEAKAMAPLQQAFHFGNSEEETEAMFAPLKSHLMQLQQVKALCLSVVDLAQAYKQSGDDASAQAALRMCVELGQRFTTASSEDGVSRLVGSAAELIALARMEPSAPYGDGQTVQERISQLKQQRTSIRRLYEQAVPLLGSLSEQDWSSYSDRARAFGEPAALQWVVGKFGEKEAFNCRRPPRRGLCRRPQTIRWARAGSLCR